MSEEKTDESYAPIPETGGLVPRGDDPMYQRLDSGELVPLATDPMAMVARALEKGIDGAMLQQFMDLADRYEANEARKAYAQDMVRCQKAMPAVVATSVNDQTDSVYPKVGVIIRAITPIYTKHGFSVSFGEGVAAKEEDMRIAARVLHKLGHYEDFFYDLPPDTTGPQGTVNKTMIHGKASSTTYGQGRLLRMIFNIGILEGDDDGNAAGGDVPGRISEEQALVLDSLVTENELNHAGIQREFRIAGWPQLAANKFDKVHSRITQLIESRNRR